MKKPAGTLPRDVTAALEAAVRLTDPQKRLAAIDKARERAALDYPNLFKQERTDMKVKLQNVRLAFPALFEAKSFEGSEPRFSASLILPPDHPQVGEVRAAIKAAAKEKWGDKATVYHDKLVKEGKICLRDGDDKDQYEGFAGNLYISAGNKARPNVLDRNKAKLTQEDGRPYAGCYVNVSIEIWAQDNKFGKRINASLGGVQFVKDGDAFSGSAPASDDEFDDLADTGKELA